jgi:hypothetical protein
MDWEEIMSQGADTSLITIKGRNSKDKDIEINITVDDYFFPYMIREMAKIARQRVALSNSRLQSVKDAVHTE